MNHALVAVGIGNTTITFGVCEARPTDNGGSADAAPCGAWSQQITVETAGFDPVRMGLNIPASAAWWVASVHRPSEQRLAEWVRNSHAAAAYHNLTHVDLPLDVHLDHPQRVGVDRLVAAVAVNQLRDPRASAVIVDAGTAITVDLVNPQGAFLGGAILPGMRLVSQALAAKTDQLPQVDTHFSQSAPDALGKSTEEAIRSGLFWGSVGAIRELVARLGNSTSGAMQVFVTGGDAQRLAPFIANDAVFVDDLVLQGILTAAHV